MRELLAIFTSVLLSISGHCCAPAEKCTDTPVHSPHTHGRAHLPRLRAQHAPKRMHTRANEHTRTQTHVTKASTRSQMHVLMRKRAHFPANTCRHVQTHTYKRKPTNANA